MKILLFTVGILGIITVNAQYFFTDIIAHKESEQQYKNMIDHKISAVKAISYDAFEEVSSGFLIEQTVKGGGKSIVTNTTILNNGTNSLENVYNNGKLVSSINKNIKDETTVSTITTYSYNNEGLLIEINTTSLDTLATQSNVGEKHLWQYNNKGIPAQMLNVKGINDTLVISFTYDENGYVAEEIWRKNEQIKQHYYYYYNSAKQLSDIVRFNTRLNKLMPDFVYEYNDLGQVIKMTQAVKGGTDYLTWHYTYNSDGLKEVESCFDRKGQLQGKIVYGYKQ